MARTLTYLEGQARRQRAGRALEQMPPLKESDDIEDYLETFEHTAQLEELDREDWTQYLLPLLMGDARAIANEKVMEIGYDELKRELFQRYNVSS